MIARTTLALIAIVVAVALAACGGDEESTSASTTAAVETTEEVSADAYEAEAAAVLDPLNGQLEEAGAAAANPDSPEAYVTAIENVQEVVLNAAAELDGITPPEAVASAQDQVVAALEDFSSALDPIKEAAESGNEDALADAAINLSEVLETFAADITEAQAAFAAEGIELDLN